MTARRMNVQTSKSPALTGGDDRPTAACFGAWAPYEVLMHETRGPGFRAAVDEARATCGIAVNDDGELVTTADTCELFATCVLGNDDQWARAILGEDLLKPAQQRDRCGTAYGYKLHRANGEHSCDACTIANRKHVSGYAEKKRAVA